ncbi:MAG: hypothetical protein J6D16_05330 [Clostridia bacterium]|nr:hypothetical protein [Clostridia bacterium]
MNTVRLTFNTSTNFTLPIGIFRVLQRDAYYYGFIKSGQPNVSGFLNNLIPALSDYQEDLFDELLKYNNGNEEIAKTCARSIHNVYLHPFAFHDDGTVNVPFRISKDKYDDFIVIHDERLDFYDTDFTNYVRTLLSEYASKTLGQREYMYAFRKVCPLREAIQKENVCKFYTDEQSFVFVPVSIETSPIYNHNYIVGIDENKNPQAIRLSKTKKITIFEERIKVSKEMCELISDHLDKIYEEEYNECLD